MKIISKKQKGSNTFRFKSFSERINEIDVRHTSLYYIGHVNEDLPEDDESYFHQTIRKWTVLNISHEYNEIQKKIQNIVTLPQVVHKKEFIIETILGKLDTATTLSLQPILELLVSLSKDLREEFYNYFEKVLEKLIKLLNTQDADQIEWTLTCLAFLFKTLKTFLKRNIAIIFDRIFPLLDETQHPNYLTNFAAECFSFVARSISNFENFVSLVVSYVRKDQNGLAGCGRLMFEIVKGVNGNFHSCSEPFLDALIKGLANKKNHSKILYKVLVITLDNICQNVHPHNMMIFWNVLTNAIKEFKDNSNVLHQLLCLMLHVIKKKDGKYLVDIEYVKPILIDIIKDIEDYEDILIKVTEIISKLLSSNNLKVNQDDASHLISNVLNLKNRKGKAFENFIWSMRNYSLFEYTILPKFILYFEQFFDLDTMELMAKIISNNNLIYQRNKDDSKIVGKHMIFRNKNTVNKLLDIIENFTIENHDALNEFILAVVICSHFDNIERHRMTACVWKIVENYFQKLNSKEDDINIGKNFTTVFTLLKSLVRLDSEWNENVYEKIIFVVLPYCSIKEYTDSLRILKFIINRGFETTAGIFTTNLYEQIHKNLMNNLFSSNSDLRFLTSEIFFDLCEHLKLKQRAIYKLFTEIENITPTVHNVREQLLLLEKLNIEKDLSGEELEVKEDCLKFLLGLLYHNFKLLWDPVIKLLEGYARKMPADTFWNVYKNKLDETESTIKNDIQKTDNEENDDNTNHITEEIMNTSTITKEVDYYNYRILLWKAIPNFGNLSEIKNRDIVTMFLRFLYEEYKKSTISTRNKEEFVQKSHHSKDLQLTLITKLKIFITMANPKQLYREAELYSYYLELLSNPNPEFQKLSLDCIMAYKNKSLLPYKEHLYNLIDEKKFKDELNNFKLSTENKTIQLEHRTEVIKIILRILCGKIITKGTTKTIGSQVRKGLIIRFLSGCEKDEIFMFLRMNFSYFETILNEDLCNIPAKVKEETEKNGVLPAKKLLNAINMLEIFRKEFGALFGEEFLHFMIKIIILAASVCTDIPQRNQDESTYDQHFDTSGIFKTIKSKSLLSLVNFFDHFTDYSWQNIEIKLIFEFFVWPSIEMLPNDSIHSPTPLLKLLSVWSKNPKYFCLLDIKDNKQKLDPPLKYAIKLLLVSKAQPIIHKTIMDMIESLLIFEPSTDIISASSEILPLIDGNQLVLPYTNDILERLRLKLKEKKNRKNGLSSQDLLIISKITSLVTDPDMCDNLLDMLFPLLVSKANATAGEEVVAEVIQTLINLLKRVKRPEKYIRNIAPFFKDISQVSSRKLLCDLMRQIADKKGIDLDEIAKMVSKLNAYDHRWIEQPNYEIRLSAFRELKQKIENKDISIDLGLFIIYNCVYFIKYDKDMGLRDTSCETLKLLIPALIQKYDDDKKELNYFLDDITLPLIRQTLRDKNDTVRNEGIQLLGVISRECSQSHIILQNLSLFVNKTDPEVDFFENLTHLQSHRHGRALLKFSTIAKECDKPLNPRCLTQFILPLVSRYLLNEKYSGKHTLIDAAIEAIGIVCQHLPWDQYYAVLKCYLQKMRFNLEYQKQLVRLVGVILDSFHFDLSRGMDGAKSEENKQPKAKLEIETEENVEKPADETDEKDESMDSEIDDDDFGEQNIEEETKDQTKNEEISSTNIIILSPSLAKRVIHEISKILIPTLNRSIIELTKYESNHKLNRRKRSFEREQEETMRVPLALAIVKLLQRLPKELLEENLGGVFTKICTFLKSPLKSVRMLTRDILKKIMLTLGTDYLTPLIDQMIALLTRGFQVHVLSVTLHGVLDCLKNQLKAGDLETCLQQILEITLNDIFGECSTEKEVNKLAIHTPEAKTSSKSFLILYIISRNINETCLLDLIVPFKDYLAKTQSKKTVSKVQLCFQKIVAGLIENTNISQDNLLIFLYGVTSESIPDLITGDQKPALSEKEKQRLKRYPADCYIIPTAPRRSTAGYKVPKTNSQANAHVLIEFGLEMLHLMFKRRKINETECQQFLNPLVPILKDSLKSTHIRVITFALKCLGSIWNSGIELPSMIETIEEFADIIFAILHKYFSSEVSKNDDNFFLVKSALKSVVSLLRKCDYYTISKENLTNLLLYVEQDIKESDKQPFTFPLLKVIVNKKLVAPEIHDIMKELSHIAITSNSDFIKEESRSILLIYVTENPNQKKSEKIIEHFATQLCYDHPAGRISANTFIKYVIKILPIEVLQNMSEVLFHFLGMRLVNDDEPECRKATAQCIEDLLKKLKTEHCNRLFDQIVVHFNDDHSGLHEMAAMLCSRFVNIEKNSFIERNKIIFPLLVSRLERSNPEAAGTFVRMQQIDGSDGEKERANDHTLIQLQYCIINIFEGCPATLSQKELKFAINDLGYISQKLLNHPHEWVRINSTNILEYILLQFDYEKITEILLDTDTSDRFGEFIYSNPKQDLKSLTLDLCCQMVPGSTKEQMAKNVMKLLLIISKILKNIPMKEENQDDSEDNKKGISLEWLIRRLRYIAYGEVARAPQSFILRSAVFSWIEKLLTEIDVDHLKKLSYCLLRPLVREMSDDDHNIDPKLRQQATKVAKMIRHKIGEELYDKLRIELQTRLMSKRAGRKKLLAQEKINDPIRAAKRKQNQQERKKESKKRKTDIARSGKLKMKRKRKLEEDDFV